MQSPHKHKPILYIHCRNTILNWVAFTEAREIAPSEAKCWGSLHNSCSASWHAMHNGNVEWKMLACYIDRQCEQGSCWRERRWMEKRRKDVEKMSADVRRTGGWLCHSLLIHSLSAAFSHANSSSSVPPPSSSLSYSTFSSHISPISHSYPLPVFSKSHFLSRHPSPCPERLMFTVFIIPCQSSFDQDSSQDLAARPMQTHRSW